ALNAALAPQAGLLWTTSPHALLCARCPACGAQAGAGKLAGMASRTAAPEKRPGIFSTIKQLITFTKDPFPWVVWVLPLILFVCAGLGVIFSFATQQRWWFAILWGFFGLM